MVNSEHGDDRFDAASSAQQMARHRFGGAESQLVSVLAKSLLDRERFAFVAERSRSAVSVDVADFFRSNARVLNRSPHRSDNSALGLIGRGNVISVGRHAVADNLGVDSRSAPASMLKFLEDHDSRAFTNYESVTIQIERTRRTS